MKRGPCEALLRGYGPLWVARPVKFLEEILWSQQAKNWWRRRRRNWEPKETNPLFQRHTLIAEENHFKVETKGYKTYNRRIFTVSAAINPVRSEGNARRVSRRSYNYLVTPLVKTELGSFRTGNWTGSWMEGREGTRAIASRVLSALTLIISFIMN